METLSLYELNLLVRQTLEEGLMDSYWIGAELSEVREGFGGHCYIEFVQKDSRSNALVAKARGTIWRNVWVLLKSYFERETHQVFAPGIKVMVQVRVQFHELYGYSLTVLDVDPSYTLGDLAHRRQEILSRLEQEGVLTLNKELNLPTLIQRIAVISATGAAGYGDFMNQLLHSNQGFRFEVRLFPAIMQGSQTEGSIIAALNAVAEDCDSWDVVVIIRGGGATSDLAGFDTYSLANNCAQFPLPVITGIGHERDDTVLDMVSHTRVKTPTAAAEFIILHQQQAADSLAALSLRLGLSVTRRMQTERVRLQSVTQRLPNLFNIFRTRETYRLEQNLIRLHHAVSRKLLSEKGRVELLQQRVDGADPKHLLERGYSYTLVKGKLLNSANNVRSGDLLETHLKDGVIHSVVN